MFSGTSVIQSRSEQFSVAGEWVLPQVFYSSNWSIQEQSSHLQESSFFDCMDEAKLNEHNLHQHEILFSVFMLLYWQVEH